jgi:hypothetical protein
MPTASPAPEATHLPPRTSACWRRAAPADAAEGVQVTVASAFGNEQLPTGLHVLIGRRRLTNRHPGHSPIPPTVLIAEVGDRDREGTAHEGFPGTSRTLMT